MAGVSGNIMFGQFIPSGTNAFKIGLDIDKLKHLVPVRYENPRQYAVEDVSNTKLNDDCDFTRYDFAFKL
jgi:hypothetical protein